MSSNRRKVQEWWENKLGCTNPENWAQYKSAVESATLNVLDIPALEKACSEDRKNYGLNAILSFLEGIASIKSRHFAWGIVKLYYSVFYALRYEILLSGHILLRCKSLYILRLRDGEKFKEIKDNKKSGDHQLTIKAERQLADKSLIYDPILNNDIEDMSPYLWLMSQRERVNYRDACFPDPECDPCLRRPYIDYIDQDKTEELFDLYSGDVMMAYVFDKEHSMVSIPYYRIKKIYTNLEWDKVDAHTKDHIRSMCARIGIPSFVPAPAATEV